MSGFRDSVEAAAVLGGFFREQAKTDLQFFSGSGLIMAYVLSNPDLRIVLDASHPPQPGRGFDVYVNDPSAPKPAVEILMDADTLDKLYRGEEQPMKLAMTGKAKAKGDIAAAMRLLPAMARAIPQYKAYRASLGLN